MRSPRSLERVLDHFDLCVIQTVRLIHEDVDIGFVLCHVAMWVQSFYRYGLPSGSLQRLKIHPQMPWQLKATKILN